MPATRKAELMGVSQKEFDKLQKLIAKLPPDEELYGGPMKGADNKWTPGRWAEAAGPSHYRSAAKYLRARSKVT